MSKLTFKKCLYLGKAAIASSLFLSPCAYAVTQVVAVQPGTINTTGTGGIEITTTGQITGNNVNGILINSASVNDNGVAIDANNLNTIDAIVITGTGNGIQVTQANAAITVNETSGINAGADAIFIQGNNALISNFGTVTGGSSALPNGSAIELSALGTNASITNQSGGVLSSGPGALEPVILVNGTGLTLVNNGTIDPSPAGGTGVDAIQLNVNFNTLVNSSTGTILSDAAGKAAINLNTAGIGGIVTNTGIITAQNQGNGIVVNQNFTSGTITNNGAINVIGGLGGTGVLLNADITTFNNNGSINASTAGDFALTLGGANTTGTINNSGSILSNNNAAVALNGTFTNFTNAGSGTITSLAAPAISASNNTTGALINSGNVNGGAGVAIDLGGSGVNINVPFTQNSGNIVGNVVLASNAGANPFIMNGGAITGNLDNTNAVASSTLNLNAGSLSGNLQFSAHGDTLNLAAANLQSLIGGAGNDIINITGGSFSSIVGGGGADILNINAPFTTAATINAIPTINLNNVGTTFTANGAITNLNTALNINAGTAFAANANISGGASTSITNSGTLSVSPGVTVTSKTFTQNADGVYSPSLLANGTSGTIVVTGAGAGAATLNANSIISPISDPLIASGTVFNIITSTNAGTIVDNATIPVNSALLSFTKNVVANGVGSCAATGGCLQLTFNRASFVSLSSTPMTKGVANALDAIAQLPAATIDPDLFNLLDQLEDLPTQQLVEQAYESLLPPINYSEVAGSHISMDNTFNAMSARIEEIRQFKKPSFPRRPTNKGFNAGEPGYDRPTSTWLQGFSTHLNQKERQGIEGYRARSVGGIIGTDWDINRCFTFGVAASASHVQTFDDAFAPKNQQINSYVGAFYGNYQPLPNLFIDASFAAAYNQYHTFHRFMVNNLAPTSVSDYQGAQYGTQVDVGYTLKDDLFFVASIARFKYTHLQINPYDEKEVGGLGLSVAGQAFDELALGAGLRLAASFSYEKCLLVPEATAIVLYDFDNDAEQPDAFFLGGGPGFSTNGLTPARTLYDLGLGLNLERCNFVLSVKYGLQLREQFRANSGLLEVSYDWQ